MFLWFAFEVIVLFICHSHGLNLAENESHLAKTIENESNDINNNQIEQIENNENEYDNPTAIAIDNSNSHKHLVSHHLIQAFEEIDKEEWNQQTTILSQQQKQKNAERMEEIEEIFNWLQVNTSFYLIIIICKS